MAWVLNYLDDLEADFRVFYRMEPAEILALSGPHFLALAYRIPAYQGVMAARLAEQEEPHQAPGTTVQDSSEVAIMASPIADLIDFG